MIRNYFKIAWRNLKKHKFYATINILGLFFGIVFTMLISAYIWTEYEVNKNLKNANQHYFLKSEWKDPNMGFEITTLGPLSKRLKEDYPSLVVNYYRWDGVTVNMSVEHKNFRESLQLGDSTLLSMYGFKLISGNKKTVFETPESILLTSNKAKKLFGRDDVLGETITLHSFSGDKKEFKITGVLGELPKNSVTGIDGNNLNEFFVSTQALLFFDRSDFDSWTNIYVPSYIELQKGVAIEDLRKPIETLIADHASENIRENINVHPVPLAEYYLKKDNNLVKRMLYTLAFIGLFILLMAMINFINISMSISGTRMREIGIRKVLGSKRKQIRLQFLIESFILVLISTTFALICFPVFSPIFGEIVGVGLPELSEFPAYAILTVGLFVIVISVLSGFYPALVLSSLNAIESLRGKLKVRSSIFQNGLVGFQFFIALLILISTFVITKQVDYLLGNNLGYDKDYIVHAPVPRNWTPEGVQKMLTIRNEFETLPYVKQASLSYEIPNGNYGNQFLINRSNKEAGDAISMQSLVVDDHYFETYGITLKANEDISGAIENTIPKVVINETAALALGWENPTDAVGQNIIIQDGSREYLVQNVLKDFHFGSMKQHIQPMVFFDYGTFNIYRYLSFKIKPSNIKAAITSIESQWKTLVPDTAFEYNFMDDSLNQLYTSELRFRKAAYNATLLSIIIVLLGIVGLVSINTQKRFKEIGVRKVLGASIFNIVALFVKEFTSIICIACLVALPISYFIINSWLDNYAYRVALTLQPFIWSIFAIASMVFLVVGLLSFKTARSNPIKSLRTE